MDSEIVEMCPLSRRFELGGFYDAVTGKIIAPGTAVAQNEVTIERYEMPNDDHQIILGKDLRKKYATLETNSELDSVMKLSVLTGIAAIPPKLSAAFYPDSGAEGNNVQVVLKRLIEVEKHSLNDLETSVKGKALKDVDATHLIVSITYGLNSFTVFSLPRNPEEEAEDQQKMLEMAVKSIAKQGKSAKNSEMLDDVECQYFGDVRFPKRVCSFSDGVNVFNNQVALTQKDDNNVAAVKIGLISLQNLRGTTTGKSFDPTSTKLTNEILGVFEKLNSAKVLAAELASGSLCEKLPVYKEEFASFTEAVISYEEELKKALKETIPQTWIGQDDEKSIRKILKVHQVSPFGEEQLTKWLESKREEHDMLSSILTKLRQHPFCAKKADLNKKINDVAIRHVICLNLYEQLLKDEWIKLLQHFAGNINTKADEFDESSTWHQNARSRAAVREEMDKFVGLAEKYHDDSKKAFVVGVSKEKSNQLLKIVQYTDGVPDILEFDIDIADDQSDMGTLMDLDDSQSLQQQDAPAAIPLRPVVRETRYTDFLVPQGRPIENTVPIVYDVLMKVTFADDKAGIYKYEIGQKPPGAGAEKVILIVGATGSGKTTLINGIMNYMFNVKWDDPFRFRVIREKGDQTLEAQAKSMTKEITAYTVYNQFDSPSPYSLTIIDTPGFGDTEGIQRDNQITEQLKRFFSNPGSQGIDHVDAVGIVVQSALARLTTSQKYVFDSVLSVFGNDIADNIFLMVTFADHKEPPVLAAVNAAGVPFREKFRFNNAALYSDNTNPDDLGKWYWQIGQDSMKKLFSGLVTVQAKSLSLTKEVLKERDRLQASVLGLQPQIQAGLAKMEEISQIRRAIGQHDADIKANKNFVIEVTVPEIQKVALEPKQYVTNCQVCNFTCHFPCSIPDDADKRRCAAMNSEGLCNVCPGKCQWDRHLNAQFRIDCKTIKKKETLDDIKKRYEDASGEKLQKSQVLSKLNEHLQLVTYEVAKLLKTMQGSISRLDQIALRPNPLTTVGYIDLLIESEKMEGRPGFQARITQLNEARKQAELLGDPGKVEQFIANAELVMPKAQKGRFKSKLDTVCTWFGMNGF